LVIWPVEIVPEMTYNVLSGMLGLYTATTTTWVTSASQVMGSEGRAFAPSQVIS